MKNIALKRILNHCTLNKYQHQRHVRVYHWLIASYSQSQITGLYIANQLHILGPEALFNHIIL